MKRLTFGLLFACGVLVAPLRAQTIAGVKPLTNADTLTSTDTGVCTTAHACVIFAQGGYSGVSVQTGGTCGTCTELFEASNDFVNWVAVSLTPLSSTTAVTSTTTAGIWQGNSATRWFRVRQSARASGGFLVTAGATLGLVTESITDTGAASPGGSNTQCQFNDSGSFGGTADCTINKATHTLTVPNLVSTSYVLNGVTVTTPLTGVSSSIGGSPLTLGSCASTTVSITGARTTMVAQAMPATYPGAGMTWNCYVSATDVVTVQVCAYVAGTPTASTYQIRIVQ